ncbi:MAG TPA: pyruvate, water dikinase regulatory protein [Chitinivibrionales bacterium]
MARHSSAPVSPNARQLIHDSPARIFIVSDATGETARRLVQAALIQFGNGRATLIGRTRVATGRQVRAIVKEAWEKKALIIHTLAASNLRQSMQRESRLLRVDAMDIMGPVLDRLSIFLKMLPKEAPGLYKHLNEGKTRVIAAVGFAFHHDDGQGMEDLSQAEVVIVGVSRSMKTPAMLYLAYHGWFAANVPLIKEISLPSELLALPPKKVFCLIPSETWLYEVRKTRSEVYGLPPSSYISPEYIRDELAFARRQCSETGWRMIETSGKSIEEIAQEIIGLLVPGGRLRRA